MTLAWFFFFLGMLSIPLQFLLINFMKKSRPTIEDDIEKEVYGKGTLGKYKVMLSLMNGECMGPWFARGVVLERWLRVVAFAGFVTVMMTTFYILKLK